MKKISEMKDKELRDYILETQSEMRTLLNKVEEEKEILPMRSSLK